MARNRENSAQIPILRVIVANENLTAGQVSDQLTSEGYDFQPSAVRMNLKRYSNAGTIGRFVNFKEGWRREYTYFANARTAKTLQYLENGLVKGPGSNPRSDQSGVLEHALTNALLAERKRREQSYLLAYALAAESQASQLLTLAKLDTILAVTGEQRLRRAVTDLESRNSELRSDRGAAQSLQAGGQRSLVSVEVLQSAG